MKLNQVIALVGGRKTRTQKLLTTVHHGWDVNRLAGIVRTYQPMDEDGESLPPESRHVQMDVEKVLGGLLPEIRNFMDLVATQESANTAASANVIVDGTVLLEGVPVCVLLFLEKQLTDLGSLIAALPTLSTDRIWNRDEGKGCWSTSPEETIRSKKVPEVIVKYEATKEHPAQTEMFATDKPVGKWSTVHLSGAIPVTRKETLMGRVRTLQEAVKCAREEANSTDVDDIEIADRLLGYLFKK